jgi:hypothetical protein
VILSTMILISSVAVGLLYVQATCENILRREFDPLRLKSIANDCRLEFSFVRKEMEATDATVDYRWVRLALKCDYLALSYLLKNAAASRSRRERLLMVYFRALFLVASAQHLFKLNEKWAVLKLSTILEYFAGILGEQAPEIQFNSIMA